MRGLTQDETSQVNGGNLYFGGVIQLAGAYWAGVEFGNAINNYNIANYNMSLGEAIYFSTH